MFARRQDRIEAPIWAGRDSSVRVSGTVTDISLGGCYMEMLAPPPVDTDLEIVLTPEDTSLRVRGTVRSSHAGLGMGIAFTSMSPASFEKLRRFAPPGGNSANEVKGTAQPIGESTIERPPQPVHSRSALQPSPSSIPRDLVTGGPTTANALETIVRLLLRKGVLTREELTREFVRLKTPRN